MDRNELRSFIFGTSYIRRDNGQNPAKRWARWLRYHSRRRHLFGAERLFLVDDGTATEDLALEVSVLCADQELPAVLPDGPVMFRFSEHLGRLNGFAYPGWWRSFTFASQIARKYGYGKIIHIESDAFVVSRRMAEYVRSLSHGWTAMWCPRWQFPETCIQIVCAPHIDKLEQYYRAGRTFWFRYQSGNGCAERALPFTDICRHFEGDRYGEFRPDYPDTADYVCQARIEMRFEHKLVPTDRSTRGLPTAPDTAIARHIAEKTQTRPQRRTD